MHGYVIVAPVIEYTVHFRLFISLATTSTVSNGRGSTAVPPLPGKKVGRCGKAKRGDTFLDRRLFSR